MVWCLSALRCKTQGTVDKQPDVTRLRGLPGDYRGETEEQGLIAAAP